MSLYDDFDVVKQKSDGWSSGMKLFQSQMQLKKAAQTQVCESFNLNFTYSYKVCNEHQENYYYLKHIYFFNLNLIFKVL